MKSCVRCNKPIDSLYPYCDDCSIQNRSGQWSKDHPEVHRAWSQSERGRASRRKSSAHHRKQRPWQTICCWKLHNAIVGGKILRGSCINGCVEKAEGHHLNYCRPFVVIWMCKKCHTDWHKKTLNQYFLGQINNPKVLMRMVDTIIEMKP